jgi:hypothetical protein
LGCQTRYNERSMLHAARNANRGCGHL